MSAARQLHWSHISMYTRCAEQYRRRYVMGEILPPGVGAVSGTGMHKAVELDLTRKMETGELAPEEEVTEAARDSVASAFSSPMGVFLSDEDRRDIGVDSMKAYTIDAAVSCASLHHRELAPLVNPRAVERKWVLDIPNFPFGLAGTIDCDEGGVIWDWKTAKQSPTADEADMSGQVTMYSLAKATLDKEIPVARLGYVVKTKTPKTKVLETRRRWEDFAPLLRALERIAEGIEKKVFPFASSMAPRPWWCNPKWCGYYGVCEGVCRKVSVSVPEGSEIYV